MSNHLTPQQQPPLPQQWVNPKPNGIPRQSNSKVWIIVAAVVGISIIGGILLVVGLAALFWATASEEALGPNDRAAIVDIDMFLDWSGDPYVLDYSGEKIVKTRFFDGSYDVDYDFNVPEDPDAPYLNCNITIEKNKADANASYISMWAGALLGMHMLGDADVEVTERNDIFRWGDDSTFAILSVDGEPFGNMFSARMGTRVFFIVFSGIYTDDGEFVNDLLLPALNELHTYAP
jgi:hypothetical protein